MILGPKDLRICGFANKHRFADKFFNNFRIKSLKLLKHDKIELFYRIIALKKLIFKFMQMVI